MFAITASVERTVDGWSSSRQLPTFYLHPAVQGILSEEQAARVARTFLEETRGESGAIFHVTAVRVDIDS
jgi:hypothetical protein